MARRSFDEGVALFSTVLDFACTANPDIFLKGYEGDAAAKKELIKVFSDEAVVNSCFTLFESDLNVSLASAKLYMHRNTLIYRINKLKKRTGLDVKKFTDAVTFVILYRAYIRGVWS